MRRILVLMLVAIPPLCADVCDPRDFHGSYGFQLSGDTRISSDAKTKPTASIGSVAFDGTGGLSGYSSAHFAGFLQGNPTTGKYEAHTDCSITWSLQDDSGNFQHFSGNMTPDFVRIEFHQTDQGGPQKGIMVRTPAVCNAAALQPEYHLSISGSFTPMEDGQEAHRVSASGTAAVREGGKLWFDFAANQPSVEGKVEVDSDCVVRVEIGGTSPMKLRGFLVNDGKEILTIETDPGATVTANFKVQ